MSSRFFEQSQFEQMIMSRLLYQKAVRYINKQSGNNSPLNSVHYYVSVKTVLMGKKHSLDVKKNLQINHIFYLIDRNTAFLHRSTQN
jgi:hypothetical protein